MGEREDENRRTPNVAVSPSVLARAGVQHWKLDPFPYDYPGKAIPWTDDVEDPELAAIRGEFDYDYADIISVTSRVESFWDEHFHGDKTIRYMLNGTGYFDLRSIDGDWVRIAVQPGDFFEWPAGIYHRFTVDNGNFITAMRLFRGSPVWTAYSREEIGGNHTVRQEYIDTYLCGIDPDSDDEEDEGYKSKKKGKKGSAKLGKEEKKGKKGKKGKRIRFGRNHM